ncbi:hypothetical protein ACPEEZ_02480 [Frigoribacterium sp. 2-23]|uniref:hypothetical protein n=1 Tax=Frigoribacterium sp. 2-23 TaxID=3415006 RepID=UPI003C6F6E4F
MSDFEMEIEVAYDASSWVSIPRGWPHEGCSGPRRWVRKVVQEVTERSEEVTRAQQRYLTHILTRFSSWGDVDELRYLYLPHVLASPCPLRIQFGFSEGPRAEALRALASSTDMQLLEPPETAAFHAEHLGEGIRAVHVSVMPDAEAGTAGVSRAGGEVVTVWAIYAFRKGPYDFRVSCPVGSLVELVTLMPEIDHFVHGIDVVPVAT